MKTHKLITIGLVVNCLIGINVFCNFSYAIPQNGEVASGAAIIQTDTQPNTVTVHQTSQNVIINWDSFSIGKHETTRFVQPSDNAIAFNRVTGNQPSNIFGNLIANGKIMLINSNGIFFGESSNVNVASLIASTANISDENFRAGNYRFSQDPNKNIGIINEGTISIKDQGLVALVAPGVENRGIIQARLGKVLLASGKEFTIVDTYGDSLITFAANNTVVDKTPSAPNGHLMLDAVANHGRIIADGGKVLMTARAAADVVTNVINMDGLIKADSLQQRKGEIILVGGNQGTVRVNGKLLAQGTIYNNAGGFVQTSGARLNLQGNTEVKTLGYNNGASGNWLINPDNFYISDCINCRGGNYVPAWLLSFLLNLGSITLNASTDIRIDSPINWFSNKTLTLIAGRNIEINAPITAIRGNLAVGTGKVITATADINIANFSLLGGTWSQIANSLPNFIVRQNFDLQGNRFIRAAGGNGTINNPYLITDVYGLQGISSLQNIETQYGNTTYNNFALKNNIDASVTKNWTHGMFAKGFIPIGYPYSFNGTFDGRSYTIDKLTIAGSALYLGLFGTIAQNAIVKNVSLTNVDISAAGNNTDATVGAIAGVNKGIISNVYSSGTVNGKTAGGLIGYNTGTLNTGKSNSTVTGTTIGPLVGKNDGLITDIADTTNIPITTVVNTQASVISKQTADDKTNNDTSNEATTETTNNTKSTTSTVVKQSSALAAVANNLANLTHLTNLGNLLNNTHLPVNFNLPEKFSMAELSPASSVALGLAAGGGLIAVVALGTPLLGATTGVSTLVGEGSTQSSFRMAQSILGRTKRSRSEDGVATEWLQ